MQKRAVLVDIAKNAAKAIAAGKVKGFTPEQNAAMSAALLAETEALLANDQQAVAALASYRALVVTAQKRALGIAKMLTDYKYAMRSVGSGTDEYDAVGIDPPVEGRTRVKPKTPSKLAATGLSNGVNKLKFKGNNIPGRVSYLIEANAGDGWVMVGSTRKQSFNHEPVVPGQRYEYRVRAEATLGQVSAWSNKAAVYDTQESVRAKKRKEAGSEVEVGTTD
jgi:hypothetical protein